jgi:VWFA-related protein
MKKLIFFIVFIALAIILIAQEIQQETIVVNIEVPVRVFDKGKFVENLNIDDFNVYEDGKLQDVVAVYLIKKTNIEREEIGAKEEETGIKFSPEVSRNFVFLFEIHEYLPKIGKAVEYFFEEVFLPGDTLKVVTPIKTYDFNVKALGRFTGKEIAKELIGQLRKDTKISAAEYRSLLNDFTNLMEFARTASTNVKTLVRKMYVDILAKLRNLRYIDEKKLLYFTDFLKSIDGPKHVFIFNQKLIVPVMRLSSDYLIEDLEDFEAYLSFDENKVKQAFSDSSISTHFIYLTKTPGMDLLSQESESVATNRSFFRETTPTSVPFTETQDLSANFFSAFREIAQTTGGTVDSSANAASSFKKAVNAAENYYLLYYRPSDYKGDGKFKSIEVKVRGKNYRITHRAGYIAD